MSASPAFEIYPTTLPNQRSTALGVVSAHRNVLHRAAVGTARPARSAAHAGRSTKAPPSNTSQAPIKLE